MITLAFVIVPLAAGFAIGVWRLSGWGCLGWLLAAEVLAVVCGFATYAGAVVPVALVFFLAALFAIPAAFVGSIVRNVRDAVTRSAT